MIVGWVAVHKGTQLAEAWFAFGMSLFGTAFVCFFGTLGVIGGGVFTQTQNLWMSLGAGFFPACLTMAAGVLTLWKRSTLTRGIPILATMKVEEEVLKGGFALTETKK